MIKTFHFTDEIQLSTHFNVKEFRCKCGDTHNILISDELIIKLEQLYAALDASKGIITSGYRCTNHDKNVGGNGSGQHTKGTAVDIIFYDKNNKPISSKIVSCKAQDIGFSGIANITKDYIYTHLDVRAGATWFSDEVITTSRSITSDFYGYFGIARDSKTNDIANDIKALQSILNAKGARLLVDGIAGDKTLAECKKYTIDKGDKGKLTAWVQARLNSLGYNCGEADGIAGNKTMAAIAEWQKSKRLGIGYLGGKDWEVLVK